MLAVARSTVAFGQPRSDALPDGVAFSDEVSTGRARYCIHGSLVQSEGPLGERLAIVVLERLTPVVLVPAEMQERYGLSTAEVRVATALATGASNAVIARNLHISPHTARRHTEAILAKVGVRTRSELVPRLLR
jgi:DNA-binding CsgD family transcriptional regulator